jgi:carboxylesterase type B
VPAERVLAAQQQASVRSGRTTAFAPSHDADTLPLSLDEALAAGACAKVPLLIGTNRDEMNLFLGASLKKLDEPIDGATLIKQLGSVVRGASDERLRARLEVYRSSRSARQLPHSGLESAPYEAERAAWDDLSPRPL